MNRLTRPAISRVSSSVIYPSARAAELAAISLHHDCATAARAGTRRPSFYHDTDAATRGEGDCAGHDLIHLPSIWSTGPDRWKP